MPIRKDNANNHTENERKKGDVDGHKKPINKFLPIRINAVPMKLIRDGIKHKVREGKHRQKENQKVKRIHAFCRFNSLFLVDFLDKKIL